MALIPEDKIAEVRDRTDIVQVVGEYVSLRKSGVNHKGLCPFHAEKTPSFNVNSAKQIFHCFGCGKSGDVITFLMEMNGQSFLDIVKDLAKRVGVMLPEATRPALSPAEKQARERHEAEKSRLLRLNALAAGFFRGELGGPQGGRARAYLERRGIPQPIVEGFQLGYAPPGWDGLVRFLEQKRVPHELAERAGLVRAREHARLAPGMPPTRATHFDLFRDRLLCPIIDLQGEIVGFSGRIVDGGSHAGEEAPKYINTPETSVFKKGEHLFGLHAAKPGMRKSGRAILVEGNFDVLAMHGHGFTETVAPMGTALTPTQVHLLHRFAPQRVYLFLDGDAAGRRAAARGVGLFLDEDLLSFVALLPRGEDPDSFLRQRGQPAVETLLEAAKESVEYFCDHAWSTAGGSVPERVRLLEEEAMPLLRKVKNETARRRYAQRLALGLDLPLAVLERLLRGPRGAEAQDRSQSGTVTETASDAPAPVEPAALAPTDVELVALIADHPRLLMRLAPLGMLPRIVHPGLRAALLDLCRRTDTATIDARALADAVDPALRAAVMRAALSGSYADVTDPERALRAIVERCIKSEVNSERLQVARTAAHAAGDAAKIRELNARIEELNKQRLGLKS